jgi:tripartite-type tricarboxylate transporter receptor subunit TctC
MCGASPRAWLLAAAMCLSLAGAFACSAAAYPDRPIHLYVPYPAGGPNDVIARLVAKKLEDKFGQAVIVENRPGGSGNTAVATAARSAPDGYTLILHAMTYAVNPWLFAKPGYSLDQLIAVSIVTRGPLVLVVHRSLGAKSVQELIALAKSRPGTINFGSGGIGSSPHLAGELFTQMANVDMQHIPYKGTNDLIADLLTGRVPVVFLSPLIAKPQVENGKLLALGITSDKRSPSWPETPTIAEAGLPGYAMEAWYAVLAPKGTPKDVIDKLSAEIAEAVKSSDVRDRLESLGNVPDGSTAAEAAAYIDEESKRWHEIINAAGLHVE